MSITSKIDPSRQLSTFIATGRIASNEIVERVESFYKKQPSNNVLWDFRYANLEALLVSDELKNIVTSLTKLNLKLQRVGKTAIVASTDLWFSLARMYAIDAEIKNLSHIIQVFRFMDEAIKWLGSEK
jgi:adenosyl cobinamide kinase/adenosyl cobinamide phosphate guanylyltransferase